MSLAAYVYFFTEAAFLILQRGLVIAQFVTKLALASYLQDSYFTFQFHLKGTLAATVQNAVPFKVEPKTLIKRVEPSEYSLLFHPQQKKNSWLIYTALFHATFV